MASTQPPSGLLPLQPLELSPLPARALISVLMANYNYSSYLADAIESVLGQTYSCFELIVCDDGSTDDSVKVIHRFVRKDSRVRLIRKSNGGQASALNLAYEQSRGSIICLIDADDVYMPAKLERVLGALVENPRVGLVVHRVLYVDKARRAMGAFPLLGALPSGWCGELLLNKCGILPNMPPSSGMAVRRELAQRIYPTVPSGIVRNGDVYWMRLAPLMSPIVALAEPLAEYRQHECNQNLRRRVTAAFVNRELETYKELWRLQHRYLHKVNPSAAARLTPLESNHHVRLMRFIAAKLSGQASARGWDDVFSAADFEGSSLHRWFWRCARYLPRPLFAAVVDLTLTPNELKQIASFICRGYKRNPVRFKTRIGPA